MADLITEAAEDLQRERLKALWERYGIYLVVCVVATIVVTGGISLYKSWNEGVQARQTAALLSLQAAKEYPQNILQAENLDMRPALRAIAELNAAAAFLKVQNTKAALDLYERVFNNKSAPHEFRHLGTLMLVRILIDQPDQLNQPDRDVVTLLRRLERIYIKESNPWAAHARLEAAVISARINDDTEGARQHLAAVMDMKNLPETLYQRAQALDHVYSLSNDKTAETAKIDKKS